MALKNTGNLKLEINAKVIVTGENHLRIPSIVRFYESLGVDTISLRLGQDFASTNPEEAPFDSVGLSEVEKAQALESIEHSSYTHPSLTAFKEVLSTRNSTLFPRTRKCYSASDGHIAYVTADGSVYIGTAEMANETLSIGNVLTTPWQHIWGGDRHLEVIEEMNRLQSAGRCPMHLCRHLKANQGVEAYLDDRLAPLNAAAIMSGLGAFL